MTSWSDDSGILVHPKLHQYYWRGYFVQMVCFFFETVRNDGMGFSDGGVWFYSGQRLYSMYSVVISFWQAASGPRICILLELFIQSSRYCKP